MANTYRLKEKLLGRFAWLGYLFQRDGGTLKRKDEAPATIHGFKAQYRFFLSKCAGSVLFFQVGRFNEFYDNQAMVALRLLGLKRIEAGRGFRARCGFPVGLERRYLRMLMRLGFPVHVVREEKSWPSGLKKRCVAETWMPQASRDPHQHSP